MHSVATAPELSAPSAATGAAELVARLLAVAAELDLHAPQQPSQSPPQS